MHVHGKGRPANRTALLGQEAYPLLFGAGGRLNPFLGWVPYFGFAQTLNPKSLPSVPNLVFARNRIRRNIEMHSIVLFYKLFRYDLSHRSIEQYGWI